MNRNFTISPLLLGKPGLTQLEFFARTMATMFKSGVAINDALATAADSASSSMKRVLREVQKSVQAGSTFARALADHPRVFSSLFIKTVEVGETSGTLAENLEYLAGQLQKEKHLVSKIRGALVYPSIVLLSSITLGVFAVFFVLPKITPLFASLKVELPWTTRLLIWISSTVQNYGVWLLIGAGAIIVALAVLTKQAFMKPITHWFFIRIPIVRMIVRGVNVVRISRVLGTILKSGIAIDEALSITSGTVDNYYYRKALEYIHSSVTQGRSLSDTLVVFPHLFNPLLVRMIRAGEESGKLEESLLYVASYYEEEIDAATKSLSTAIEPMLLLTVGLVVAFLALSIITPIFKATSGVSQGL